ncbi:hypothetical protein GQ457_02G002600 [Hibiscus cannabinus]
MVLEHFYASETNPAPGVIFELREDVENDVVGEFRERGLRHFQDGGAGEIGYPGGWILEIVKLSRAAAGIGKESGGHQRRWAGDA